MTNTTHTLRLIDEYLTQGGYTPGIDGVALYDEARLVAAAPVMLAALETALEMLIDSWGDEQIAAGDDQVANVIKDAIDKAKGN